jgi:hypothetical protein
MGVGDVVAEVVAVAVTIDVAVMGAVAVAVPVAPGVGVGDGTGSSSHVIQAWMTALEMSSSERSIIVGSISTSHPVAFETVEAVYVVATGNETTSDELQVAL